MKVTSPLTQQANTQLFAELEVKRIKSLYQDKGVNTDRFFKELDKIQLYECKDTGYRFYFPEFLIGDTQLYDDLQKNDWYYIPWKWENEIAKKFISSTDRVLDVGCGEGYFLQSIDSVAASVEGLELNSMAIKKAQNKKQKVTQQHIQDFSSSHVEKFDCVCSFQVLEHIYDVHSFLEACIRAVKPGGKLIIGVPYSNPYLYKHDLYHTLNLPPHHMGLWDEFSLQSVCKVFPQLKLREIQIEKAGKQDYFFIFRSALIHRWGDSIFTKLVKYGIGIMDILLGKNLLPIFYKNYSGKTILVAYDKLK